VLTVTVPDADALLRLSDLNDRVELVLWDLFTPLPPSMASRVDVVAIPHYCVQLERWHQLAGLPNLTYVMLPSAGYEHALPWIADGVTLTNGRGVHSAATAELAVGLVLASQRGLPDALAAQHEGRWSSPRLSSLADRRVVVVGAGSLANAIVDRLRPFEVTITQIARTARDGVRGVDELVSLMPEADIVILAVPGSPSTRHLMDAAALAALPDGALVVNVARGPVVDTDALLAELQSGRLRAALDVTDPEPLPSDHPLWHAPNTIITAHQGGNTDAVYPRVAALIRRQLEHLLAGEGLENVVSES
jgi:phosphoglycerate dehydrogenase-like enzyme